MELYLSIKMTNELNSKDFLESLIKTEEFIMFENLAQGKAPISQGMSQEAIEEIKEHLPEIRKEYEMFTQIMEKEGFKDYFIQEDFKRSVIEETIANLKDPNLKKMISNSESNKLILAFGEALLYKFNDAVLREKAKELSRDGRWIDQNGEHYSSPFGIRVDHRLDAFIGVHLRNYVLELYGIEYKKQKQL